MTVVDVTGAVLGGRYQLSDTRQLIESTFSTCTSVGQDGISTGAKYRDRYSYIVVSSVHT